MKNSRAFVTAFAALALTAAASASALALTLEEAKQNGVRLGFPNEPPNTYVEDGEVTGVYNELVKTVFAKMGVDTVEGVVMDFSSLIPGLQAGRLDVIPAIYIRPQRCEQVAFSLPTERGGTAFLVAAGNPLGLHNYDDLVTKEAVVGVMAGAVEHGYATKAGVADDKIVPLQDQASLLEALKTERINVVILTPPSIGLMAENSEGAAERAEPFSSPTFANAFGGIAFRQGDEELVTAFNAVLKDFIGTPEFMELMAPVGYTEDNLPGAVTTAEACAPEE